MTDRHTGGAALLLLWIRGARTPECGPSWNSVLVPEIELLDVGPERHGAPSAEPMPEALLAAVRPILDDRPYAIAATGPRAEPALALAGLLSPRRPPARLLVAGRLAPPSCQVSCPITAFARQDVAGEVDRAVGWSAATSGDFAVRLLAKNKNRRPPPERWTLLAVKEDLQLWPR